MVNQDLSTLFEGVPSMFASSFLSFETTAVDFKLRPLQILSILPTQAQGGALLEYYIQNVSWIYHIIHVPTVKAQLKSMYTALGQDRQPDYSHLAIISTIFALSAYFGYSTPDLQDAKSSCCTRWTSLLQRALCAANYISEPTMEAIQSVILISQHLLPNIGAVSMFRTLTSIAMNMGRTLGIHKVDSPSNKRKRKNGKADWVEVEIKRRVWWHLTATDW